MQLLEMFYKERLRALGWSLVLSLLVGCSESAESPSPQPVAVSVVELKTSEVRPSREFVARTSASARADITARIEAEILSLLVQPRRWRVCLYRGRYAMAACAGAVLAGTVYTIVAL